MSEKFPPIPKKGRTCRECCEGWTCEAHPRFPWPHPTEDDPTGQCAGPGMPCLNGCLFESEEAR